MDNTRFPNQCILPFTGMHIHTDGMLAPCCMYKSSFDPTEKKYNIREFDQWQTDVATKLQQQFLNGTTPKGCSVCFNTTKEITSGLRYWSTDRFFDLRKIPIGEEKFAPTEHPSWLDLKFGNFCNLKCIMCHPESSSQIATEYKKNKSKFLQIGVNHAHEGIDDRWWEEPETFGRVLEQVKHADYISLAGGEPLLVKQIFDIFEHAPRNCVININTNLSKLTDQHIDAISKRVAPTIISVSLDGIGAHHEYIRYGSDWETIDSNIRKIVDLPDVRVVFTYLLQNTSLYTYMNFHNYIKQFNHEVQISTVNSGSISPGIMTINSASPPKVERFRNWYDATPEAHHPVIDQWLKMYRYDIGENVKFKQYISLLDELRGCNFAETFNTTL